MAMTKVKNLQLWCKKMAEGYRDVEVRDMAASWKSGLAFCAIIHRFRPDLIDYDSLSKENIFENNQLAFEVAEKQLSIPAFLEASDMVAIRVPDKLSIVTYVSQYYNYFHNKPQLGGPGVNKFGQSGKKKDANQPVSKSAPQDEPSDTRAHPERQMTMSDKCAICHEKIYLLERHIENSKLYHRSCFRKSELSPTSKVFKRHPYSSAEDDKNDLLSNKQRKIDNDKDKTTNRNGDSGLDFWQRRAQNKAVAVDTKAKEHNVSKSENGFEASSNPVKDDISKLKHNLKKTSKTDASERMDLSHKGDNGPSWKRDLERKKEDQYEVGNQNTDMNRTGDKQKTGLADRFRKLDEQNLKILGDKKNESPGKQKLMSKSNGHTIKPSESDKSGTEFSSGAPKPKTRQSKLEPMETETNEIFVPKPVPRFQTPDKNLKSPRAAPRKHETKFSPLSDKDEFTRPVPQSHVSKADLNLTPPDVDKNYSDESPTSPPPLPSSSPPKLHGSYPPQLTASSVVASPRNLNSNVKAEERSASDFLLPPSKPQRASAALKNVISDFDNSRTEKESNRNRSASPMGTVKASPMGTVEAHKSVAKGPQVEHSAKAVQPKQPGDEKKNREVFEQPGDEKKNREVFGGLLKSLADVRKNYDADSDRKSKVNGAVSKVNPSDKKLKENVVKPEEKISINTNLNIKKKSPVVKRPKSSFISQSSSLFDDSKSDSQVKVGITKTTTTTTTVSTSDKGDNVKGVKTETITTVMQKDDSVEVPDWKKKLEQQKKEKLRPKSIDILHEGPDVEDVPEWKIEAERRKAAWKGGYLDPEKAKLDNNKSNNSNPSSNDQNDTYKTTQSENNVDKFKPVETRQEEVREKSKSPIRRKIPFVDVVEKTEKNVNNPEIPRKKITVGQKFNFEDVDVTAGNKKPPRPHAPPSPRSAKELPVGPGRPPPPKNTPVELTLRHISPYQIQEKLHEIDSKLTQLELKGRTLEDTIRNATDTEEDDLMMAWFELVNEKNELVRKECDYIYISREQELETEQHQIDLQLRDLVDKPDKTEEDLKEEEYLVEKLVDIVNQRSKIVDSIDEDRLRYMEEDSLIEAMLQQKGYSKDKRLGGYKKEKKTVR